MNRRRADRVVGILVAAIVLVGGALSWQAYQQQRALDEMMGSMMGTSMGSVHGTNPLWYVLGTVLVASVVGGLYLTVRDSLPESESTGAPSSEPSDTATVEPQEEPTVDSADEDSIDPEANPRSRVLDLLPEDERRVLEPVLTSPGLTQIELRDRSEFSKSKVSQTVTALEKRGLLYRERQGRTYRIYPSDELAER
ncbi:MarR family transcriptional regulator (plasmid) [Salinigranum rubrum]|uniref:MarR family transcriptional regulator n=1 Tax=Salinigranum rubrum TaxID=755307 RepID=A0A2I8VR31_9EURY|nr:MarR family transcriptional regulator [Salinigranum rubrum]AUV84377.1 MarR family transcriptional regulator [Salinigranum rubrum]